MLAVRSLARNALSRKSRSLLAAPNGTATVAGARLWRTGTAANYASATQSASVTVGTASDGLKVVSVGDSDSGDCVLSVAIPAGSRHERVGEPGLAHHLKNWAFQSTFTNTALAIAREAEIHGGSLSSSLTREALFLTAEFHRKNLKFFLELLRDVTYLTKYNAYEAESVNSLVSMETERAFGCPEAVIGEALHKTAFRAGLGNSLYARPNHVNIDDIAAFGTRSVGGLAVVAVGAESSEVLQMCQEIFGGSLKSLRERLQANAKPELVGRFAGPTRPAKPEASKYFGGEDRIDAPLDDGHLAIAYFTSGPTGSQTDAVAQVLKAHLEGGKATSFAADDSPLSKIGAKAGAAVNAFAFSYSDAGLFGVRVRCRNERAGDAVKGVIAEIKRVAEKLSPEELKVAITRAKVDAALSLESKVSLVEYLASQALAGSQMTSVVDLIAKLDSVKSSDVSKLAQTMLKSKPTFVAYGNTLALPFADSI